MEMKTNQRNEAKQCVAPTLMTERHDETNDYVTGSKDGMQTQSCNRKEQELHTRCALGSEVNSGEKGLVTFQSEASGHTRAPCWSPSVFP